jgi:hypothetical protein
MKKFSNSHCISFVLLGCSRGSVISSGQVDLSAASSISSEANTFADGVQMAVCLATIKGVNCVMPNVGWNS